MPVVRAAELEEAIMAEALLEVLEVLVGQVPLILEDQHLWVVE